MLLATLKHLDRQPVAVLSHERPDADAIGSQVGITLGLRQLGIPAQAFSLAALGHTLQPLADLCGGFELLTAQALEGRAIILVDCADPSRVAPGWTVPPQGIFLNIDHHLGNNAYGQHACIDVKAAATAQILAQHLMPIMNPQMAQALYTGIMTDTVQFQSSSTHAEVFELCAQLCKKGAQPSLAAQTVYYQERLQKMQLLALFLSTLRFKGSLGIGTLTQAQKDSVGALPDDLEGLVQYPLRIQNCLISALIEDTPEGLRGSLRARHEAQRVDLLAQKFGGGGHACAAGFRLPNTRLTAFLPRLIDAAGSF